MSFINFTSAKELVLKTDQLSCLLYSQGKTRWQTIFNLPSNIYKLSCRIYLSFKHKCFLLSQKQISEIILEKWEFRLLKKDILTQKKLDRFFNKVTHFESLAPLIESHTPRMKNIKAQLEFTTSDFYRNIKPNNNIGLETEALIYQENPEFLPQFLHSLFRVGSDEQIELFLRSPQFNAAPLTDRIYASEYILSANALLTESKLSLIANIVLVQEEYKTVFIPYEEKELKDRAILHAFIRETKPEMYQELLNEVYDCISRDISALAKFEDLLIALAVNPTDIEKTALDNIKRSVKLKICDEFDPASEEYVNDDENLNYQSILACFEILNLKYEDFINRMHSNSIIYFWLIKISHLSGKLSQRDHYISEAIQHYNFGSGSSTQMQERKFIKKYKEVFGDSKEIDDAFIRLAEKCNSPRQPFFQTFRVEKKGDDLIAQFFKHISTRNALEAANTLRLLLDSPDTPAFNYLHFQGQSIWGIIRAIDHEEFIQDFIAEVKDAIYSFSSKFGWHKVAFEDELLFDASFLRKSAKQKLWNYYFCKKCGIEVSPEKVFYVDDAVGVLKSKDWKQITEIFPFYPSEEIGQLFRYPGMNEEKALFLLRMFPEYATRPIAYQEREEERVIYLLFIALKEEWYGVAKEIVDTTKDALQLVDSSGISLLHYMSPSAMPFLQYLKTKYSSEVSKVMIPSSLDALEKLLSLFKDVLEVTLSSSYSPLDHKRNMHWEGFSKEKLQWIVTSEYLETWLEANPNGQFFYDLICKKQFGFEELAKTDYEARYLFGAWHLLCPHFHTYLRKVVEDIVSCLLHDVQKFEKCVKAWDNLCSFSRFFTTAQWVSFWKQPLADGKTLVDILSPLNKECEGDINVLEVFCDKFMGEIAAPELYPFSEAAINEIQKSKKLQILIGDAYWLLHFQKDKTKRICETLESLVQECLKRKAQATLDCLTKEIGGLNYIVKHIKATQTQVWDFNH